MVGTTKGAVRVEVEGETFRLMFGFNAQAELESLFNMTLKQILDRMAAAERAGGFSVQDLRGVLWASMLRYQPGVSLADAGDLMQRLGQGRLGEVYIDVLTAAGLIAGPDEADDAQSSDGEGAAGKKK